MNNIAVRPGMDAEPPLADGELDNLVAILGEVFIQRRDLYAAQREDGRYMCVRQALTDALLIAHLVGNKTLGAYVLDECSQGRYLVFDADDAPGWRRLKALANVLAEMSAVGYLEQSRRGGHLWLFFDDVMAGEMIRKFGQGLMFHFGLGGLELFPKQGQLSTGPGSLIRLPFGIHRKTGRRYGFYWPDGRPLAPKLREQIRMMEMPQTVRREVVEHFIARAPATKRRAPLPPSPTRVSGVNNQGTPVHDLLKAAISVRDFVGHYVELSPSGTGLCPFHDDQVESFSVNDDRNFWYCFACEIGGSAIDFWMNYRECEYKVAVKDLAGMLL